MRLTGLFYFWGCCFFFFRDMHAAEKRSAFQRPAAQTTRAQQARRADHHRDLGARGRALIVGDPSICRAVQDTNNFL